MSSTIGNTKDLESSRTEALQGLISSLGHTNDGPSSGATLSAEQLQKLSDKIDEILGGGTNDPTLGGQPSQLMSEDGLPILDISEPVNGDSQTSTSPSPFPELGLTPFSLLPLDERERQRRERERILDMLEEEECLQQRQEEQDVEEARKDAIRKRKESAKAELDQLKAARELQKRMGQALVQHTNGTGENRQEQNARLKPQITSSVARKSVSFAGAPTVEADERDQETSMHQPDWGDVTLGRLRARGRVPLVSKVEAQKYPVKMRVVERRPTATPFHDDEDSDDESTSSAGPVAPYMENDSSDEEDRSSSSNSALSDNELLEELDYDTAQDHREIALEYHKKRHTIGAETVKATSARTLDDYEQHETSNGQLLLSRFRADRMAASYDKSQSPASTSTGQTVVPASRRKSLRNSVRLGKLENEQLVGGESGESGSEDETIKEIIQMLQADSVLNAGPDFKSTVTHPRSSDVVQSPSVGTLPAAHRARPSMFKLAREGRDGGITETSVFQDNSSVENARLQPAISSVVERRTPRSLSSRYFPINRSPLRSPVEPAPPMIIDSPSLPTTASTSAIPIPSSSPAHSVTLDSPSPNQTQVD